MNIGMATSTNEILASRELMSQAGMSSFWLLKKFECTAKHAIILRVGKPVARGHRARVQPNNPFGQKKLGAGIELAKQAP